MLISVLKDTFYGFLEHKILKMSASLAYTTVFSMAPLLLVVLYLCDILLSRDAIEGLIYTQTKDFIGVNSATQLQSMIKGLSNSGDNKFAGVIGVVTLLIGATSVFAEIQDSINTIWGIRPKTKNGFWLYLKSRLLSFGVIGSLGFILLVSLGISTLMDFIFKGVFSEISQTSIYFIYIANFIITTIIITLLFGSIFTILPDAHISWKQVRVASITTAILFMGGKFIISYYIANSNVSSIYGTAGSFVILMIWVYYSSVILYFGAEFSKCYALKFATPIKPLEFAEIIQNIEITSTEPTLQKAEKEIKELKNTDEIEIKPLNQPNKES